MEVRLFNYLIIIMIIICYKLTVVNNKHPSRKPLPHVKQIRLLQVHGHTWYNMCKITQQIHNSVYKIKHKKPILTQLHMKANKINDLLHKEPGFTSEVFLHPKKLTQGYVIVSGSSSSLSPGYVICFWKFFESITGICDCFWKPQCSSLSLGYVIVSGSHSVRVYHWDMWLFLEATVFESITGICDCFWKPQCSSLSLGYVIVSGSHSVRVYHWDMWLFLEATVFESITGICDCFWKPQCSSLSLGYVIVSGSHSVRVYHWDMWLFLEATVFESITGICDCFWKPQCSSLSPGYVIVSGSCSSLSLVSTDPMMVWDWWQFLYKKCGICIIQVLHYMNIWDGW